MGFLGHVYGLSSRIEEGTSLIQQTLSDYESMGLGLFRSLVGVQLGESLLLAGRTSGVNSVNGVVWHAPRECDYTNP